MDPEPYRKIGRGGAGNFYSRQDVDEIAKRAIEDIEAQQNTPSQAASSPAMTAPGSDYINSGRGGAGNFRKASAPTSSSNSSSSGNSNLAAVSSNRTPAAAASRQTLGSEMAYSGRGGAGNYRHAEGKRIEAETLAKMERDVAHEELVRRVEMGLKVPERAHLVGERVS